MKTTIDSGGRLVIPKQARDAAGLKPGVPLEVVVHDGRIEIAPVPRRVVIATKGRVAVARAAEGPKLSAAEVERTRRQLRERR